MPRRSTTDKAKEELRRGKKPTTAAGEFVKEEVEHVREGKHGARSPKQAIAIGLSKARRAGVPLKPPEKGRTSKRTRRKAERDYETGQGGRKSHASPKRKQAASAALKKKALRASGSPQGPAPRSYTAE